MKDATEVARFRSAVPYWVSLLLVPLVALAATRGGWALLLPPAGAWWLYALLDAAVGRNSANHAEILGYAPRSAVIHRDQLVLL